jgi:hypothetical protein
MRRTSLLVAAVACSFAACSGLADFAAKQQQYNRQMGMSGMNDMTGQTKLDNTPDPFPHSASQDEQRAQDQANQDYQRALQAGQDRETHDTMPDPSTMDCDETSTWSGSANSGSGTTTRNCRARSAQ